MHETPVNDGDIYPLNWLAGIVHRQYVGNYYCYLDVLLELRIKD